MGKYLSVWGVRLIYPAGFLLDGLSFVVFGLLHWVQDTNTFLVLSYLIRIVEGVGAAATWNSNLSILMAKFPERKASVKAWCDAAFNLGLTLGPVLGAAMYEAGGFCLPFAVTGAAIIASGAAAYLVTEMPSIAPTEASQSVLSLAARPAVTVALLTATVAAYTIGTVEATLSTFLEASVAGVTVRTIAAAFLTMSLASVAATPLSGWLCDTRLCPWLVSCGGCLLMLACFTLLGPGKNIFIDIKNIRVLSVVASPVPRPAARRAHPGLGHGEPRAAGGRQRCRPRGQLQLRAAGSCHSWPPRSCGHPGRGRGPLHLGVRGGQLLRADDLRRAVLGGGLLLQLPDHPVPARPLHLPQLGLLCPQTPDQDLAVPHSGYHTTIGYINCMTR